MVSLSQPDISAVLLGGGDSRRMGFPKEMIRVDGEPLAVKQVRKLQEIFPSVAVSSNHPGYLDYLLDCPIWEDELEDAGPLAGVLTGLQKAETDWVFFLSCDLPAIPVSVVQRVADRAAETETDTVAVYGENFVCAAHHRSLISDLEVFLDEGGRSVLKFMDGREFEKLSFPQVEDWSFRDVDGPEDLWILERVFEEVEPLPVKTVPMQRVGREGNGTDQVVVERPLAVRVNGVKIATVMSIPNAGRELATGLVSYLGLIDGADDLKSLEVDYESGNVSLQVKADDDRVANAVQFLVTSTCGGNIYGAELEGLEEAGRGESWTVCSNHLLECLRSLRSRSPIFERTGGTHQVAFTDGEGIRYFYEDVGRHNALDKVVGKAILDGYSPGNGALLCTGRISTEMVFKALRQGVPVIASKAAVTSHGLKLAEKYGLTVAGFARGGRINIYNAGWRITGG